MIFLRIILLHSAVHIYDFHIFHDNFPSLFVADVKMGKQSLTSALEEFIIDRNSIFVNNLFNKTCYGPDKSGGS